MGFALDEFVVRCTRRIVVAWQNFTVCRTWECARRALYGGFLDDALTELYGIALTAMRGGALLRENCVNCVDYVSRSSVAIVDRDRRLRKLRRVMQRRGPRVSQPSAYRMKIDYFGSDRFALAQTMWRGRRTSSI